jgi:hypothetical protein
LTRPSARSRSTFQHFLERFEMSTNKALFKNNRAVPEQLIRSGLCVLFRNKTAIPEQVRLFRNESCLGIDSVSSFGLSKVDRLTDFQRSKPVVAAGLKSPWGKTSSRTSRSKDIEAVLTECSTKVSVRSTLPPGRRADTSRDW